MSNSWLEDILGEPVRLMPKLAKLPFIDDNDSLEAALRPATSAAVRAATDAFLRRKEQEETWKAILDDEDLAKAVSTGAFDNRQLQDDSQPKQGTKFPELPRATDPRKPVCSCDCQFCRTQDCKNCCADEKCEFAHLSVLSELAPLDEETAAEMYQAAASKQRGRLRKARVTKHKSALLPAIHQFRKALWPKPSASIDLAVDAVANAVGEYVASAVAGEF
ncbi:MAG: hypothetical protein ABSD76_00520 [Terriglobales bacterium]|jgi:hypothetical protein